MMMKSLRRNRFLSLTLFSLAVTLTLSTYKASATIADGVYAYEQGDYQQARAEWLPYAAMGNSNALYNLGQLYRMGRGVKKNYIKARDYYLRAAEKGHIGAQRNLGTLYYFGRIGKIDQARALIWLTKAAINDDTGSQFMVGIMKFNGKAGKKNYIQAYAWISLAAKNGLGKAKIALTKIARLMTAAEITQAKKLAPDLISHQLTPDNIGLMVKPLKSHAPNMPKPNNAKLIMKKNGRKAKVVQNKPALQTPPTDSAITTPDGFRVQLGSYRAKSTALKTLKAIKNKFITIIGNYRGNIKFADLGKKGIFYRLQLSPFASHKQASALCSRLKRQGQNCYVIKTR